MNIFISCREHKHLRRHRRAARAGGAGSRARGGGAAPQDLSCSGGGKICHCWLVPEPGKSPWVTGHWVWWVLAPCPAAVPQLWTVPVAARAGPGYVPTVPTSPRAPRRPCPLAAHLWGPSSALKRQLTGLHGCEACCGGTDQGYSCLAFPQPHDKGEVFGCVF